MDSQLEEVAQPGTCSTVENELGRGREGTSGEVLSELRERIQRPIPLTWVFGGDSHISTHKASSQSYLRGIAHWARNTLKREHDIFVNATQNGATFSTVQKRVETEISRFQPNLVTLFLGTGDLSCFAQDGTKIEQKLIEILKKVYRIGAIPVVCVPPCANGLEVRTASRDFELYQEMIRGCVAEFSGVLVDHGRLWETNQAPEAWWNEARRQPTSSGILAMLRCYTETLLPENCLQVKGSVEEFQ